MKLDEESRALAHEVGETLFKRHNTAFAAPQVVSPETVWKHIIKKYSPGLPWIGRYRTRADLATSGWMQALINATYKRLETGEYPPQVYQFHAIRRQK